MKKIIVMKNLINLLLVTGLMASCVSEPEAAFSYAGGDGIAPEEITFKNESTDADEYYWNFGDGNFSTEENPVHQYSKGGNYYVILEAKNRKYTAKAFETITLKNPTSFQILNYTTTDIDNVVSYYLVSSTNDLYVIKKHGRLKATEKSEVTKTEKEVVLITFTYGGRLFLVANHYIIKKNEINKLELYDDMGVYLITKKNSLPTNEKIMTIKEMISKY